MNLFGAIDMGQVAVPAAQVAGRFLVVVVAAAAALRVAKTLIRRVDDARFREQLLFFVPKIVVVVVVVAGLAAIGIDVSGMAAIMARRAGRDHGRLARARPRCGSIDVPGSAIRGPVWGCSSVG